MRVIHVAPTAFGSAGLFGGGERYPLELAVALAEHVDCELVTIGTTRHEQRIGRLLVRTLRPAGHVAGHPARPIVPSLPGALVGADLVHVHQARSPTSLLAATTARLLGVPTVVTDHGLQGWGLGKLAPYLYDRFLVVSRSSAAELGAPASRTHVIFGGADPARYHPEPGGIREGLLFVGRLTPHKGVDVLLRALPPDLPLTVVGSEGHDPRPPERDYPGYLRALAAGKRVEFTGPIDDDRLARMYRSALAVVIPSVERTCYGRQIAVSELLGLVAIEAMASGTPVIASRVGGLPEVVTEGVTGYLVPPGDVSRLADRIGRLARDPTMAERMGARGRRQVLANLTWDRCAQRCVIAYRELVTPALYSGA